jgi:hypothetical protein
MKRVNMKIKEFRIYGHPRPERLYCRWCQPSPQPKDEHYFHLVAAFCRHRCLRLPGHSPTKASPIRRGNNYVERLSPRPTTCKGSVNFTGNTGDCCAMGDNLRLQKLRLFTSPPFPLWQDFLKWHNRHWDIAIVCTWVPFHDAGTAGRKMTVTWAPLQLRGGKEYCLGLVMMFVYAHDRYLMARMTHSPDGGANDDRHHAKSCRSSCQRQGESR